MKGNIYHIDLVHHTQSFSNRLTATPPPSHFQHRPSSSNPLDVHVVLLCLRLRVLCLCRSQFSDASVPPPAGLTERDYLLCCSYNWRPLSFITSSSNSNSKSIYRLDAVKKHAVNMVSLKLLRIAFVVDIPPWQN